MLIKFALREFEFRWIAADLASFVEKLIFIKNLVDRIKFDVAEINFIGFIAKSKLQVIIRVNVNSLYKVESRSIYYCLGTFNSKLYVYKPDEMPVVSKH